MFETDAEIDELDALLDEHVRTREPASDGDRQAGAPPERASGRALPPGDEARRVRDGQRARRAAVAPLDGVFIHGRFTVSTGGEAARLRHLRANPACSAAHMDGDTVGIVVHGHATIIGRDDPAADEIEPVWREIYGSSPFEWGEGVVFMRIEPTSMWAYAFHPENFPE